MKKEIKEKIKCLNCDRVLKPDKKAVIFGTKRWNGHSYFACKCSGKYHKNYRISIG